MKKVIEISIGGINFSMEDDAYFCLKEYLTKFENTILNKYEAKEVMEDVEARIAEIFQKEIRYSGQVIDIKMVNIAIEYLGEIDEGRKSDYHEYESYFEGRAQKKFYRDPEDKKIAGVCSGLSAYFGIDVTLIRIIFVVALLCYGSTLVLYLVLWLATKEAITVAQKLEMRGVPVTAENIKKYTSQYK